MPHDGQEETDQEKINRHMVQMENEQGRKDMAKELIQQRRVIRQNGLLYTDMLEHFEKAKGVAKAGATMLKQVQGMQWDLLQLMAQVTSNSKKCNDIVTAFFLMQADLKISEVRRESMEWHLTDRMKRRLSAEYSDPRKEKERIQADALLAPPEKLDKIIAEESRTQSKLDQVVRSGRK